MLNDGKVDIALVAGEPAYEAFQGIGMPKTTALVIQAIYSNPGMFAVRGDSPAKSLRDLDRQADRLGHQGVGADLARALRRPTGSGSTATRIFSRTIWRRPATGR